MILHVALYRNLASHFLRRTIFKNKTPVSQTFISRAKTRASSSMGSAIKLLAHDSLVADVSQLMSVSVTGL